LVAVNSTPRHQSQQYLNNEQSKITNYLEGCQFIFDVYINNDLKNYTWYYKYRDSPKFVNIVKYLSPLNGGQQLSSIFDYVKGNDTRLQGAYLDTRSYHKYVENNKRRVISDIIRNINPNIVINPDMDFNALINEYITYHNIENILDCRNKVFINTCFEVDDLVDVSDFRQILSQDQINMLGGCGCGDNMFDPSVRANQVLDNKSLSRIIKKEYLQIRNI
jgi:hypothetical protein